MVLGREAANIRELMMFGQKDNSAREIYTSFYTPKTGADGVWELPLVLETVAEASETTIPLPLPYRKLNAEVLEYLEDVAQQMPKGEEARIVVYLPIEEIQQGLEQKLNKVLDIYGDARLEKLKREEKRALGASLSALAWGFAFMLVCQIIGVLADFPNSPTRFRKVFWSWVGLRSGSRSKPCCSIGDRRWSARNSMNVWRRCRSCCGRCRRRSKAG